MAKPLNILWIWLLVTATPLVVLGINMTGILSLDDGVQLMCLLLFWGAGSLLVYRLIYRPYRILYSAMVSMSETDIGAPQQSSKAAFLPQWLDALQSTLRAIRDRRDQLHLESSGLKRAVEKVGEVDAQNYERVSHQLDETQMIATAVNEMAATAQEVAKSCARAAEAAGAATSKNDESQAILNRALTSFQELASEVRTATDVISDVNREAERIGGILDVISGISEQTNLVALNAAIEAARAGEHGRGFSVVADEVRTLANRTHQSANEIRSVIEQLQVKSQQAVSVMAHGRQLSESLSRQAEESTEAMVDVGMSVTLINDMNVQIANAAEEQTAVSEEINANLNNLALLADAIKTSYDDTLVIAGNMERHTDLIYKMSCED